jgi:hypothetical protein
MSSTESHPEYSTSFNRIESDMKDAEDRQKRGDAAGASAAAGNLINDVIAAQYRFGNDPNYMKSLNQELIDKHLLPPGFELTGTTHTDKGNYLKMRETKFGNTFNVSRDEIERITPKQ